MTSNGIDRRTTLHGIGATVAGAFVAGCLQRNQTAPNDDEPVVDVAETTTAEYDPDAWTDVDEIRLDGYVGGWVGVEPAIIDRVENPTLQLVEGRTYDLTWTNRDAVHHSVALWNDEQTVVDDYETIGTPERGASETLAFEADRRMHQYVCLHQRAIQLGDIEFV